MPLSGPGEPASRALPDPGGDPIEVPSGCALWLAAFSSACRESRLPLTSCRGRALAEANTRRLERPTSMPRQRHRFGHSQTPSTDECPLDPTLARRASNAGPPPSRGFATPSPASDAPSLPRPVKGRGLDQAASPRAHRSGAFEATRRSSTSANETIRKHDHRTFDTRPCLVCPDFRQVAPHKDRSAVLPSCIPV